MSTQLRFNDGPFVQDRDTQEDPSERYLHTCTGPATPREGQDLDGAGSLSPLVTRLGSVSNLDDT